MRLRSLLLAVWILATFASSVVAAPSVTGASGTFSSGSTVTVSGSGFGSNTANQEWTGPAIEAGTSGSLFSRTNWSGANDWSPVTYKTDAAHSGSKSLGVCVDTSNNWNGLITYALPDPVNPSDRFYISWWARKNGSNSGQWKMLRLSGQDTIVDGSEEMVLFNWLQSSTQLVVDPGTSNDQTFYPGSVYVAGDSNWYRQELIVQASSANGNNGQATILRSGTGSLASYSTPSTVKTHTSSGNTYSYILFQNYMGNGITGSPCVWMDDIYILNGWSRVEMCDSSTWAGRSHCEIQPRVSWSSTSINVTLNPATFSEGSQVYLYVVDSDGAANANGYAITLGGSGSSYTVTPSAGANGSISPSTPQTVNSGSTTAFTVTPNSGYTATVGGTCGGSLVSTTYTTNAITANCTVSATFTDTTAPTVAITAPTAAAYVAGASVAVTASASDNSGAVSGVQFKLDGANLGAEDTAAPFSITWNTTIASQGAHSLTATARDAAGNSATSAGIAVTVDNTAPTASAALPTGAMRVGTTAATLQVTTSEAADCRYSATSGFTWGSGTPYSTTGGTAHSSTVTVTGGRNYRYYSRCIDPAGNSSNTVMSAFYIPRKPLHKVW